MMIQVQKLIIYISIISQRPQWNLQIPSRNPCFICLLYFNSRFSRNRKKFSSSLIQNCPILRISFIKKNVLKVLKIIVIIFINSQLLIFTLQSKKLYFSHSCYLSAHPPESIEKYNCTRNRPFSSLSLLVHLMSPYAWSGISIPYSWFLPKAFDIFCISTSIFFLNINIISDDVHSLTPTTLNSKLQCWSSGPLLVTTE